MDQNNKYQGRKFYRCSGPKVGRMEPTPKRQQQQQNVIFFKYVEGRVLIVLLLRDRILVFYFLPTYTLMNNFSFQQFQERLGMLETLGQVFLTMKQVHHQNYQFETNNTLKIPFRIGQQEIYSRFQLQPMPKTTGHRKAELTGVEVLSQEMEEVYTQVQSRLLRTQKMVDELKQNLNVSPQKAFRKQQIIQANNAQVQTNRYEPQGKKRTPKKIPVEVDLLSD